VYWIGMSQDRVTCVEPFGICRITFRTIFVKLRLKVMFPIVNPAECKIIDMKNVRMMTTECLIV
jgi:hypothetical protein